MMLFLFCFLAFYVLFMLDHFSFVIFSICFILHFASVSPYIIMFGFWYLRLILCISFTNWSRIVSVWSSHVYFNDHNSSVSLFGCNQKWFIVYEGFLYSSFFLLLFIRLGVLQQSFYMFNMLVMELGCDSSDDEDWLENYRQKKEIESR